MPLTAQPRSGQEQPRTRRVARISIPRQFGRGAGAGRSPSQSPHAILASGEFDKVSANIAWRGIVAGRLYRTGRGIGVEVPGTDKVAAISISQKDIDRKATEALTGRRGRLVFGFSERTSDSPLQAIKSRGCSGSRTAGFSRGEDRFGSTASCEPGFAATARRESIDSRPKGKPVRHPGQTSLTQEDDHGGSSSDDQLDAATRAL